MKQWERARGVRRCGLCGEPIASGEPLLAYEVPRVRGGTLTLIRCGPCEGGAPPDLPFEVEREVAPLPPVVWSRLGLLPMDYAQRAAGEREPGEEG